MLVGEDLVHRLGSDVDNRPDLVAVDRLATGMAPTVIPTKIDIASDLVGDTGIEPVTSSV